MKIKYKIKLFSYKTPVFSSDKESFLFKSFFISVFLISYDMFILSIFSISTISYFPSYSVKPKSIDFTGFDDFILPQIKAESDGYRSIMYRIADK